MVVGWFHSLTLDRDKGDADEGQSRGVGGVGGPGSNHQAPEGLGSLEMDKKFKRESKTSTAEEQEVKRAQYSRERRGSADVWKPTVRTDGWDQPR